MNIIDTLDNGNGLVRLLSDHVVGDAWHARRRIDVDAVDRAAFRGLASGPLRSALCATLLHKDIHAVQHAGSRDEDDH